MAFVTPTERHDDWSTEMLRKITIAAAAGLAGLLALAPAAAACGFLVSPSGAVRLVRTSTFVAWDGATERYITNFEFAGAKESFGSIIPLPAEPTDVRKAGSWTLQRLEREVRPQRNTGVEEVALDAASAEAGVEVILETRVDSLDITVVKGGGADVAQWADENGFALGEDAADLLDFYSDRSPYFLAARFDAAAAVDDGFQSGDGIPVLIEMPTDRPWVPLHILAFDKPDFEVVEADVFLLTPDRPELVHGRGLTVNRSEEAGRVLLDDLRSDENMEWIPEEGWFSHLELEVEAAELNYDLSVGADGTPPSLRAAGLTRFDLDPEELAGFGFERADPGPSWWALGLVAVGAGVVGGAVAVVSARRTLSRKPD